MPNAIRAVSREPKNHKNPAGSTPLRRMYTGENSVTTSGRASRTSGIPLITSNSKPSTSIFTNRTRLAAMRSPARYASRVTVSTSMPALRRLVQEGQKPRPLQASRRRRRCSGPARIRSPGSRSRGNARTHLRRIWAGPRPHRCAPPSRRERSSNALARSRARASAQAPGVDTLGPPRRPTTTTWCMPHPRPRPSDGGMITNRAKRTLVAAPRTKGAQAPERATEGLILARLGLILKRWKQRSRGAPGPYRGAEALPTPQCGSRSASCHSVRLQPPEATQGTADGSPS